MHQLFKVSMSRCNMSQSDEVAILRDSLVSSAYRPMSESLSMLSNMSFIKRTNRSGPNIEPYGTPDSTSTISDVQLSNTTRWVRFDK